jgi:uncharacterized repeat protein (TIGR03803 family)
MRYKNFLALALGATVFAAHALAQAGGVTVLHAFTGGADGAYISSGLVVVPSGTSGTVPTGTVFGTARDGGGTTCVDYWSSATVGCGTVYGLVQNNGWQFSVVYTFTGATDGAFPGTLTLGPDGTLYGMTGNGGPGAVNGQGGLGVLFELVPARCNAPVCAAGGLPKFRFKVLYNFCSQANCADGAVGGSELLLLNNALIGTTPFGGANGLGTVFKYDLSTGKFTTVYSFKGSVAGDGAIPYDGVVADPNGNLYGTTYAGGAGTTCANATVVGCGTVYQLTPTNHGAHYQETVLYAFKGAPDGAYPGGRLILYPNAPGLNGATAIIGNTGSGGSSPIPSDFGFGATFEIYPSNSGWGEKILVNWGLGCLNSTDPGCAIDQSTVVDGSYPNPNIALAVDGTLWLSTYGGGNLVNANNTWPGTINEIVPQPTNDGMWPFKQWDSFTGANYPILPQWGMVASPFSVYPNLVFYGTTSAGGGGNGCPVNSNLGCGTIYQFIPPNYPD